MPGETVFVTGATGFIAKHVVLQLLDAGYRVVGSVRSLDRAEEVRDAVRPHLKDAGRLDERLRFVALDLTRDEGWTEALAGAEALLHTASPFPMRQPDDEAQLIRPAVDGALRALRAARDAGVRRVVLTSSVVAVEGSDRPEGHVFDEDDWTEVDRAATNAYAKSKTLAERAAWDFVRDEAPEMALTAINPALVLGPPLDRHYGTSVQVVERILRAKDPMLPQVGFSVVDVRDVAAAHVAALQREASAGQRIIVADRYMGMPEIAKIIKAAHPERKVVTRRAPDLVVRFLGLFDRSIKGIVPLLGRRWRFSHARAEQVLGIDFIPAEESVRATADWLIRITDI